MSPQRQAARRHTRWLLIVPILGIVALWTGVYVLEAIGPEAEVRDMRVEVPPLHTDEVRRCTRQAPDAQADEIRRDFVAHARVSSTQVYLCPVAYDQLRVTYVGEVIGDVLRRRGGAWVQVNDDRYALEVGPLVGNREGDGFNTGMSVWLPDGLHEQIEGVGRPGRRGDVIKIQGRVFRADPDDGGGVTIRAEGMTVLARHQAIEDPLHVPQAVTAGLLAVLALAAMAWSRRVRRL